MNVVWTSLALFALAAPLAALAQGQAAPPRNIDDILQILDQHKPDPARLNRLRAEVAKPPPQTTDPVDLRRFYVARGEAAGEIGFVTQQLADLRKAIALTPAGDPERWNLYIQIAVAEYYAGDYAASMRMWEEVPVAVAPRGLGQQMSAHASLARARALLGDRAGAQQAFAQAESLLPSLRSSPGWTWFGSIWQAMIERSRAHISALEGKHAQAEAGFRKAIAFMDQYIEHLPNLLRDPRFSLAPLSHSVRLAANWESDQLAFALLEQGKFAEAELSARNGLKRALLHFGRYAPESGGALQRLARIIFEQGRFQESAVLSRAAVDIYERIGAAPYSLILVNARRNLAAVLVEQAKYAEADAIFASVRSALRQHPPSGELIGGDSPAWVYALVRLGRIAEAVEQARALYEGHSKAFGDALYETVEARGYLALALAAAGRHEDALREFRAVVPALLSAAGERSGEEGLGFGRTLRLTRILNAYITLLGRFASEAGAPEGLEPMAEAFRIADVARGSSVQRALTAAAARGAIRDPQLAGLAREEQDSGQRVGTLTSILVDLLSRPPEKQLPTVIASIRKDIEELRKRRAGLKQEIEKRFPDYANLIDPKPVPLEAVRKALAPGEALIVLYGTEERTFAWALPREGPAKFHAAALGGRERDGLVAALRRALDVGEAPLERFPQFDLAAAYRLYSELLAPLQPVWGKAESLLIVPHGSLGQLPFGLLVTQPARPEQGALLFEGYKSVPWLLRRAAVTQLPSVNTLVSLRSVQRARAPAKPFIGFGDPVFGPQQVAAAALGTRSIRLRSGAFADAQAARKFNSVRLESLARLPDTAEEINGIADILGANREQDVFLGTRASEHNVKSADLSDRRVVGFATHGLVPGDLDGLTQPALALSNPQATGEKDSDGLLAMDEILGLRLNADWVLLSACNTASGEGAGSEAVSGLGRAFFYAGARALLVSNWPVETVSARLLTTDTLRRYVASPGTTRAEALRQAMLELLDNGTANGPGGKPAFSYAHPFFWAPFTLVGDGG